MFKITKGSVPDTFDIVCYNYVREANFYSFLYSVRDKPFDFLASLLQGSLKDTDDLYWIIPIVSLTNQPAVIGEDGILRTVPVHSEKEVQHGERESTDREEVKPRGYAS